MIPILLTLVLSAPPEETMFHLHNSIRSEHSKQPLGINDDLCKVAKSYARFLFENNKFGHNYDGGISNRLSRVNYSYSSYGENLFKTPFFYTEKEVMNGWMNSRGHRRNILGNFREIGIGFHGNIWCVVFATPTRSRR